MKHFLFFSFVAVCLIFVGRSFYEAELIKSQPTQAVGFGISPPTLPYEVKPGEEISAHINLLRNTEGEEAAIRAVPALKELSSWVTIEDADGIKFSEGSTMAPAMVRIKVPADAESGEYRGQISFIADSSRTKGVAVNLGAHLEIILTVDNPLAPAIEVGLGADGWKKYRGRIIEAGGNYYYLTAEKAVAYALKDIDRIKSAAGRSGLGITDHWLNFIPIGLGQEEVRPDSDRDGLSDLMEETIKTDRWKPDTDNDGHPDRAEIESGYDPLGKGETIFDPVLANRLAGRIILQVEDRGQAWYVDLDDNKRYFLGDGENVFALLSQLAEKIGLEESKAMFLK